ncbi:HIT domain-containing protein [bacterium]|nr:HIT domain-containing protein [bacterium]
MNKKIVWAPWRIDYITAPKEEGCFLCRYLEEETKDKENFLLYRGKSMFITLNLYPYNNGHILIAPNRHIKDFEELTSEEESESMQLIKKTIKILKKVLKAESFNLGVNIGKPAGAGLDSHIHFHIVPRWIGDTNFMPVVADTKVISQSLKELYNQLKKEFES